MPIYAMRCTECDSRTDIYRRLADIDRDLPVCCCRPMVRALTAPFVVPDLSPYKSAITGEPITSRRQHREHLREHKCIEIGNEKQPEFKPHDVSADLKKDLIPIVQQHARFN